MHNNGSFNGLIGMVQNGEVDVILADIPITSEMAQEQNDNQITFPNQSNSTASLLFGLCYTSKRQNFKIFESA